MKNLKQSKFGEFDIYTGDEPYTDVLGMLRGAGALDVMNIEAGFPFAPTIEREENVLSQLHAQTAFVGFERTRSQVRELLRAIVGFAVEEFDVPNSNGCDIGSGATGEMLEELMAPYIEDKRSWAQMDISQSAVDENRRRHPLSNIFRGYYLRLCEELGLNGNLDVVTGLSSLDSTQFVEEAVEQIESALKPGGTLLHVQDVRPGPGVLLREMAHEGHEPPYSVEKCKAAETSPIISCFDPGIPAWMAPRISTGELFRRNLGRAIDGNDKMELVFNEWVTARRKLQDEHGVGRLYYLNSLLGINNGYDEASAVVTVARKK